MWKVNGRRKLTLPLARWAKNGYLKNKIISRHSFLPIEDEHSCLLLFTVTIQDNISLSDKNFQYGNQQSNTGNKSSEDKR